MRNLSEPELREANDHGRDRCQIPNALFIQKLYFTYNEETRADHHSLHFHV